MALEKRTSRLFGSRISAIFSSNDHPHLQPRDQNARLIPSSISAASNSNAQPLSRAPLVNPSHGHINAESETKLPPNELREAPITPVRGTKYSSLQVGDSYLRENSPDLGRLPVTSRRLHRKPPPEEAYDDQPISPVQQLHQISLEQSGLEEPEFPRRAPHGLTDIIGTLEQEIGNMMGSSDHIDTHHRPPNLREASSEPVYPLEIRRDPPVEEYADAQENTFGTTNAAEKDRFELPPAHSASNQLSEAADLLSPQPETAAEHRYSPIFLSPSKDILQGPLLPAHGFGRRSMQPGRDARGKLSPSNALGGTVLESSPLKSILSEDAAKLPESDDFAFAANEDDGFVLAEESESVSNSQNSQHQPYFGSGDAISDSHSASQRIGTSSRDSLAAQVLPDSMRLVRPTKSRETDASGRSDPLSELSAFFKLELLGSGASAGSKTNLDGIPEDSDVGTSKEPIAPGYPINEPAIELQLNFSFGTPGSSINPRSPLKQTPTFASTDSGVSRTWSTTALLQNFHARVLLTSSITSSGSNRHVNLATLKRSFSLRPGEGERSNYVQSIRRNAGTAYNDAGPVKWKLPTGILPIDKKSLYLQTSNKFNRGGSGPRSKKTSGVELKHGHLQARLLASEVDDTEDSNKFGSLGRSSTNTTTATAKVITPVTSKSSATSTAFVVSRQNSLNRSNTLASGSTDAQSVGTRGSSSKLSTMDSEVLSLNSDGSVAEYQFGDGYYQHPGYKFDDDEDIDTERFSPITDEGSVDRTYDDELEDDDEEEKPRLFLANPDSSSDDE